MKLLKIEKWWLIIGVVLYATYNIPGIPAYGDAAGAVAWNIGAFALMWFTNYFFNARICKIYEPRKTTAQFLAENAEADRLADERAKAEIEAEEAARKAAK